MKEPLQEDGLIEYASYCGNYYGTPREYVEKCLQDGRDVILEIEIQGALKVKEKFPEDAAFVRHAPQCGRAEAAA